MASHFLVAMLIALLVSASSPITANCGVVSFPNGTSVDLTSYSRSFAGKVAQTGSYPGDYTWHMSPCTAICGGSSYLSQESGGDSCSVKVKTMTKSPTADGNIIVMSFGPTTDSATGLSWKANLRLLCGSSSSLAVVGNEYLATVVGTAVTTHWTVTDSAFCAPDLTTTTECPVGTISATAAAAALRGALCVTICMLFLVVFFLA